MFSPLATRAQRLGLRRLERRPAYRICLDPQAVWPATAAASVLALIAATLATLHGIPLSITVPVAALAPLLVEHLPDILDVRAGENARTSAPDPPAATSTASPPCTPRSPTWLPAATTRAEQARRDAARAAALSIRHIRCSVTAAVSAHCPVVLPTVE
ncbi:hypothetical protein [Streptomyces sp. BK79]|uniref:hypothetical protein n=1 Tax=Streptomyces sp. BK79 TaxID=3350097 RepID=UPI00376F5988